MELFANIVIENFWKNSILDLWLVTKYASGISKVECYLKVKVTLYTKVQGKVNTNAKVKIKYLKKVVVSCKSMRRVIWWNSWKSSSEMFQKNSYSKTYRKTCVADSILIQVYSLQPGTFLKTDSITDIFPQVFEIAYNSYLIRRTIVISCLLSYHVHYAPIPHQCK